MALYLLLFRGGDPQEAGLAPDQMSADMDRWDAWSDGLKETGRWQAGQPLENEGRVVESNGVVSDGPFAETKELIGGFVMVDVEGMEEAVDAAKDCPLGEVGGRVEIRPVSVGGRCSVDWMSRNAHLTN